MPENDLPEELESSSAIDQPMGENHRRWLYNELVDMANSIDEKTTYTDAAKKTVMLTGKIIGGARSPK